MKTIKKIFQSISLLLILALLCSTPVYAKTSDKGKIEKVTTAYFKAVKNYNKNGIKNTLDNKKFDYWNGFPKMQKHIRKLHKDNLQYDIKKIKVKGNTATVTVKVSFYSAYDDSKEAFKEVLKVYHKNMPPQKMIPIFSSEMKRIYQENQYYFEPDEYKDQFIFVNTTKIPLIKKGGTWRIAYVTPRMQYQMDCVTTKFWNDLAENPLKTLYD